MDNARSVGIFNISSLRELLADCNSHSVSIVDISKLLKIHVWGIFSLFGGVVRLHWVKWVHGSLTFRWSLVCLIIDFFFVSFAAEFLKDYFLVAWGVLTICRWQSFQRWCGTYRRQIGLSINIFCRFCAHTMAVISRGHGWGDNRVLLLLSGHQKRTGFHDDEAWFLKLRKSCIWINWGSVVLAFVKHRTFDGVIYWDWSSLLLVYVRTDLSLQIDFD